MALGQTERDDVEVDVRKVKREVSGGHRNAIDDLKVARGDSGLVELVANRRYRDGVAELPIQDCPRATELKSERSLRRNRGRHRSQHPGADGSIRRDNSSGQSPAIRHSIEMSDQWSPPQWARRRDRGIARDRTGRRRWRRCRGRD